MTARARHTLEPDLSLIDSLGQAVRHELTTEALFRLVLLVHDRQAALDAELQRMQLPWRASDILDRLSSELRLIETEGVS
jgi:hypothetical protein